MTAHSKDDGMREALKPCPFCGSDRITVWNIRDGQQAVCKDCKSTGAPTFHGRAGPSATRDAAIAAWNARALLSSSAAASGVVEALEEWDRWDLVIESAIRNDAPSDHAAILRVIKKSRAALAALSSSRSAGGSEVATRAEDGPTAPTAHGNKDHD